MAQGDLVQILELPLTTDGKVDVTALNTILRQMQERVFALEGRTQPSQIRDDLEVLGNITATGELTAPIQTFDEHTSVFMEDVAVDGTLAEDIMGIPAQSISLTDFFGVKRDLFFPSPFSMLVREEFIGRGTTTGIVGELGWGLLVGTVAGANGTAGHVGVAQLDSGAGPAVGQLFLANTTPASVQYLAGVMRFNAGTGAGSDARFGLLRTTATAGNGARGMYFHAPAATGFWTTVTRDSSGITTNTTSFPIVAGEYVLLEIVMTTTTIDFYINRRRTFRHITNIETAGCLPAFIAEATGAPAAVLDLDSFAMVGSLGLDPKWD